MSPIIFLHAAGYPIDALEDLGIEDGLLFRNNPGGPELIATINCTGTEQSITECDITETALFNLRIAAIQCLGKRVESDSILPVKTYFPLDTSSPIHNCPPLLTLGPFLKPSPKPTSTYEIHTKVWIYYLRT